MLDDERVERLDVGVEGEILLLIGQRLDQRRAMVAIVMSPYQSLAGSLR